MIEIARYSLIKLIDSVISTERSSARCETFSGFSLKLFSKRRFRNFRQLLTNLDTLDLPSTTKVCSSENLA